MADQAWTCRRQNDRQGLVEAFITLSHLFKKGIKFYDQVPTRFIKLITKGTLHHESHYMYMWMFSCIPSTRMCMPVHVMRFITVSCVMVQ